MVDHWHREYIMKRLLMALPLVLCMNANAGFVTGVIVGSMMSNNDSNKSEMFVKFDPNTTIQCHLYENGFCWADLLPGTQRNTKTDNSGWLPKVTKVCEVNYDDCVEGQSWFKYDIYKVMTRMGFSKIKSITITKEFDTFIEFE